MCCALLVLEIEMEGEREREPGERREEVTVWRHRCGSTDIHKLHKLHKQGADQPKILAISAGPGQVNVVTLLMCHGAHRIQSCRTQNRVTTHTDHPDSGK